MHLVDTHCHVDFPHFNEDRDAVFDRYAEAGGDWLLTVSVDLESLPGLFALAESRENVWCSVGVHPNHETPDEPDEARLRDLARHPKCVAIGETGMDFFRHVVPAQVQEARFRTHIRAARSLDLPVIVHMREADADTLRVLRDEGVEKGVMHCFSSTWEVARAALDLGMHISFSGNVTFGKNAALREVAARVPLDRLLVETDSPYLAPVPMRGKRNEPAFVRHVAECVAAMRGMTAEALTGICAENAARLFDAGSRGVEAGKD